MHETYDLDLMLELAAQKQFRRLKELIAEMNVVDIAEFLDELDPEQQAVVFRLVPRQLAAEVFTYLEDSEDQEKLINALSDKELRAILDELYLDDAVDIIEEMPANVVSRMLRNTNAATRSQINQLLNYPDDSAGSIMTTEFVYLHPNATVEESFARIRQVGLDKETVYTCYVTQNRVLLGVVTVRRLLLSSYETRISDIMRTEFAKLPESSSIMDCIIAMSTARVGACILVHEDGSLAGVFTHGDFARAYQKDPSCGAQPVRDIMTKNPVYVEADKLAIVAVKTLRDRRIDDLVVLDEEKKPVGLIDTQDLVRLKLI